MMSTHKTNSAAAANALQHDEGHSTLPDQDAYREAVIARAIRDSAQKLSRRRRSR